MSDHPLDLPLGLTMLALGVALPVLVITLEILKDRNRK